MIIAGSDTTASTLAFCIEFLARHEEIYRKLQNEVEEFRGHNIDPTALTNLPILNAVINETLRVRTIVPSKSQRIVPDGGLVIAGEFIPGGTHVSIPFYALSHDKRNFSPSPNEWRPERWINPSKEEAMNKAACTC